MLNITSNISTFGLNSKLSFKNSTLNANNNISTLNKTVSQDSFNQQILKQNNNLIVATSLLTVAAFIKIGIDLLKKTSPNLNKTTNLIYRKFESLKDNKNIPTIETCKSINQDLKKILERQIALVKAGNDIISETGNPQASNRLLLAGPAGVGKSFFAKIFAKSLDAEYKEILYSDFNSRWIGEHTENLTELFKDLLQETKSNPKKKYVVVFNELDTLLNPIQKLSNSKNSSNYGTFKIEERSIFLNYLEILKEQAPNLTIIGTTNISPKSKNLDQAALSRFQNIIEVPYPDKDCIYEALKMNLEYLKNSNVFFSSNEIELKKLAEKMAERKCSFRNLEYIVNEAKNIHMTEKVKNRSTEFNLEYLKKGEQNLKFSDGELEFTN